MVGLAPAIFKPRIQRFRFGGYCFHNVLIFRGLSPSLLKGLSKSCCVVHELISTGRAKAMHMVEQADAQSMPRHECHGQHTTPHGQRLCFLDSLHLRMIISTPSRYSECKMARSVGPSTGYSNMPACLSFKGRLGHRPHPVRQHTVWWLRSADQLQFSPHTAAAYRQASQSRRDSLRKQVKRGSQQPPRPQQGSQKRDRCL